MKLTLAPYGATNQLHINDRDPVKVAEFVTTLFNFGVVSNIPEDFKPGEHESVVVCAPEKKLEKFFTDRAYCYDLADVIGSFRKGTKLSTIRAAYKASRKRAEAIGAEQFGEVLFDSLPTPSRRGSIYSEDGRLCGDLETANNADNVW